MLYLARKIGQQIYRVEVGRAPESFFFSDIRGNTDGSKVVRMRINAPESTVYHKAEYLPTELVDEVESAIRTNAPVPEQLFDQMNFALRAHLIELKGSRNKSVAVPA